MYVKFVEITYKTVIVNSRFSNLFLNFSTRWAATAIFIVHFFLAIFQLSNTLSHSLLLANKQNTSAKNFGCSKSFFFPFKIPITARISHLAGFANKQFNLHRYNTTTHNNKRLKLRYLADSEVLKLTAQARTRLRDSHGRRARSAVTVWRSRVISKRSISNTFQQPFQWVSSVCGYIPHCLNMW